MSADVVIFCLASGCPTTGRSKGRRGMCTSRPDAFNATASFGVAARVTPFLEGIRALRFPRSSRKGARLHRIVRYKFYWFAASGLPRLSLLTRAHTVRFRPLHRQVGRAFYFFGVIRVALFFLADRRLERRFLRCASRVVSAFPRRRGEPTRRTRNCILVGIFWSPSRRSVTRTSLPSPLSTARLRRRHFLLNVSIRCASPHVAVSPLEARAERATLPPTNFLATCSRARRTSRRRAHAAP